MVTVSNYINNLYDILNKLYVSNSDFKIVKSNNKYNFNSEFIPLNIRQEILNNKLNFTIKSKNIVCNIWCNNLNDKIKEDIKRVLNRFNTVIKFFDKYNLNYNKKKFILNYIPTKLKKSLPIKKNTILGANEINSGLSYIYQNIIYIWREEEFDKVFIHELFHCLGYDRFLIENENLCELSKYFNVKNKINCNEGYNEFCALIYHCCFLKLENKKLNLNKLLKDNLYFTFIQIKKILNHYNLNNFNREKHFKQDTSVFSYFILKGMYLYYINEFIDILLEHTFFLVPKISFSSNLKNFNFKIFNDENFIKTVNNVCINYNKKLSNSLKMSYK